MSAIIFKFIIIFDACIQVERMLNLILDGGITVASIESDRGLKKKIKPIIAVNPQSGKESSRFITFSSVAWGKAVRAWGKNAKVNLEQPGKFEKVLEAAKHFEKAARQSAVAGELYTSDEEDERALLNANDSDDRYGFRASDLDIHD
jgi:hypothetical protein